MISDGDKEGTAVEAQFREGEIGAPAADGSFIVVAGGRVHPQKRLETRPVAVTHVVMRRGILLAATLVCHRVTVLSKASTLNACAALSHATSGQGYKREKIMKKSRLGRGSEPDFCLLLVMRLIFFNTKVNIKR